MIRSGYNTITVQEYIQGQAVEPFVILRHDIDRRQEMALEMAGMEKVFSQENFEGTKLLN